MKRVVVIAISPHCKDRVCSSHRAGDRLDPGGRVRQVPSQKRDIPVVVVAAGAAARLNLQLCILLEHRDERVRGRCVRKHAQVPLRCVSAVVVEVV